MSLENWNDIKLNQTLLKVVDKAIQRCVIAYEGKAKSFAVVLNDLEMLAAQLQTKLISDKNIQSSLGSEEKTASARQECEIANSNKMYVYVRLFHKEMPSLLSPGASKAWIKPLLESIKNAEKHGLAIYANEQDVQKSLKGEGYGYATLIIDENQDVSSKRSPKIDPILHCPLLTILPVELKALLKFTYSSRDYFIKDGLLQMPSNDQEVDDE